MHIDHEIGDNFKGVVESSSDPDIQSIYKSHTGLIAESILKELNNKKSLGIVDLGGGPGIFSKEIAVILNKSGIHTNVTNVDKFETLLSEDKYSNEKVCADIVNDVPQRFVRQFDLALMRYVLQYNSFDDQQKILANAALIIKEDGIFILHHAGAVDERHRAILNSIFSSDIVSTKLKRQRPYWSTNDEVDKLLSISGFDSKTIKRYTLPLGNVYKERYNLSESENEKLFALLGKYDFLDYSISINTLKK